MATLVQIRRISGADLNLSQTSLTIIIVLLSIGSYNVIELLCIIFGTFKRYSGLYFWSFLTATLGIALSNSGFFIKYLDSPGSATVLGYVSCTLSLIGWVTMVTGQSLVLWSRLHLVMQNKKRLRMVWWMIITDAVIMHGTMAPMAFGCFTSNSRRWIDPFEVMERIEVVVFFLQEAIISSIYIIETLKLIKLERYMGNAKLSRRLMKHLILVNIVVIMLDASILALQYANQYDYQISYKTLAYSLKLKLEFTILNRLVDMTTAPKDTGISLQSKDSSPNTLTKNSIALESYIAEGERKPTGNVSYQAYARGGGESSSSGAHRTDDEVLMTTEVIVKHSQGRDLEKGTLCTDSTAELVVGDTKEPIKENTSKFVA